MDCLVKYKLYDAQGEACGTGSRVIDHARSTTNATAKMFGGLSQLRGSNSGGVAIRAYAITDDIPAHARAAVAALVPVEGRAKKSCL